MGLGCLGAVAGQPGLFPSHIPTGSSCGSSALSPRRRGPAPQERRQCRCHVHITPLTASQEHHGHTDGTGPAGRPPAATTHLPGGTE